jgi:hypothetical protein
VSLGCEIAAARLRSRADIVRPRARRDVRQATIDTKSLVPLDWPTDGQSTLGSRSYMLVN